MILDPFGRVRGFEFSLPVYRSVLWVHEIFGVQFQWRRQDFAPGWARRACSRYPAEITEIST